MLRLGPYLTGNYATTQTLLKPPPRETVLTCRAGGKNQTSKKQKTALGHTIMHIDAPVHLNELIKVAGWALWGQFKTLILKFEQTWMDLMVAKQIIQLHKHCVLDLLNCSWLTQTTSFGTVHTHRLDWQQWPLHADYRIYFPAVYLTAAWDSCVLHSWVGAHGCWLCLLGLLNAAIIILCFSAVWNLWWSAVGRVFLQKSSGKKPVLCLNQVVI